MNGATLDLTASIVNLRRLADKLERGETIVLPRPIIAAPALIATPTLPPPPPVYVPAPAAVVETPTGAVPVELPAAELEQPALEEPTVPEGLALTFEHVPARADEAEGSADETDERADDLARLEQVRAEMSELTGRRLSPWTRRRLEEAQAEERDILGRLGFDSYLDLMLTYAAGTPQSEPALSPSAKLPSLASFASLPSASSAAVPESGAGGDMDSGGSVEASDGGSVHEIGDRLAAAPVVPPMPPIAEPANEVPEPEAVPEPAGPSTIADWLRGSSFAGARLVDVNAGA